MDNPLDQGVTPNQVAHIHHYVLKGSGLSCYAECDVLVRHHLADAAIPESYELPCGEKLASESGPIVGSRAKIERALGETSSQVDEGGSTGAETSGGTSTAGGS